MKNERAAIMALTFCIGFTTAMIAYGIPVRDVPVAYVPTPQTASVADTIPETVIRDSEIILEEDGLFLNLDGEKWLVSIAASVAPLIVEAHTVIHSPVMSPDNKYLFYCAETLSSGDECVPRIYDVEGFTVYAVTVAGNSITVEPSSLNAAWSSSGILQINELVATSQKAPWRME